MIKAKKNKKKQRESHRTGLSAAQGDCLHASLIMHEGSDDGDCICSPVNQSIAFLRRRRLFDEACPKLSSESHTVRYQEVHIDDAKAKQLPDRSPLRSWPISPPCPTVLCASRSSSHDPRASQIDERESKIGSIARVKAKPVVSRGGRPAV